MDRERHITFLTKAASGALAAFALFAGACASKAGGPEKNPTAEPTATRISAVLPTTQPPTQVEATATAEPVLSPEELQNVVMSALETLPGSQDVLTARGDFQNGITNLDKAERGEISVKAPINDFGDTAVKLASLACANPENLSLGVAWKNIKSFVAKYSSEKEAAGQLVSGATKGYLEFFFNPPCVF